MFVINSIKIVLVRKGHAFYVTLYQDVFFAIQGEGGVLNIMIKILVLSDPVFFSCKGIL